MAIHNAIDPMEELLKYLSAKSIAADWLLCPGDITSAANHLAFTHGWDALRKLREKLTAKQLVATTGNHEISSRASETDKHAGNSSRTVDPVGLLQEVPDYPAEFALTPDKKWVYWGRGYEVIENDELAIVLLNSCHSHVTMQENEYERGKISDVTLKSLTTTVNDLSPRKKFRILLMHHHPIKHQDHGMSGEIDMFNGTRLIETLQSTFTDWLIIHGHKHDPRLIRSQGAVNQPIVFSAGSFGAELNGVLATKTRNQFYVIELESRESAPEVYSLAGRIEAHYWSGTGWHVATDKNHGIPYGCGFAHLDVLTLAKDIQRLLSTTGTYMKWDEIRSHIPDLNYLMPDQIDHLRHILTNNLKVKLHSESNEWFPKELSL